MNPTLIAQLLRLAVKQGPAAVRAALAQLKKSGVADDVISSVMTKVAPPARKLPKNGARGGVKGMAPQTNPNPTSGPRPGKDKMKWKTRAKGALRFAKENPGKAALSAGLGGLGVLGGVQFAEQLGTTAGLDPFDYQGRLKKVRDLQAIPGFVEGVEGGGELFLEGERNRLLKGLMERGGSPDPIGDLLADQDLRTILEGREAELRGLGVGMSPEPLSPSEIAARLGL